MFGYRVHQWGGVPKWEEMADPTPGRGEVAIKVQACGVGRTVLNCINGDLNDGHATLPRVPGHELVGTVTEVGAHSAAELEGELVAAYFYLFCGECPACIRGVEPHCARLEGWIGVHRDGGYAPRVVLPARNAIPIPHALDAVDATVVPDALATPIHVAGRAAISDEDRVVVIGAGGGVGIHMIQVAQAIGAEVVGLDRGPTKLAAVEERGVNAVDSSDFKALEAARLFSSGSPSVIVDLIGTDGSTRWSLDHLGTDGRLVTLTTFPDSPRMFEARHLVFREASILGSRYATRTEVSQAARMLASGDVAAVVGAVCSPEDVLDLHRRLESESLIGRGAIDWREEAS